MPKLDANIYGEDNNTFASGISSDALSPKQGNEDIWGSTLDQSAVSKSNNPSIEEDEKVVERKSNKADSRAKSEGN